MLNYNIKKSGPQFILEVLCLLVCEEGPGICAHLLTIFSVLLIIVTLPFSLCLVVQVVQVILRYRDSDCF